jgi:hypothetical protein
MNNKIEDERHFEKIPLQIKIDKIYTEILCKIDCELHSYLERIKFDPYITFPY